MYRVFVALSGGVDSATSAFILKQKGYQVFGVYMHNWDSDVFEVNSEDGCVSNRELRDVKDICNFLNIPLYTYNFSVEYYDEVFLPYLSKLEKILNTNPDILCNSKIKFGYLIDRLVKDFGDDIKVATGHWAKIIRVNGEIKLGVCRNLTKDQTYFLSGLSSKQLSRVIFPLENIESKEELREIAKNAGLSIWDKKDSVGICFIGKQNYQKFISKYIENKEGYFVDIETGKVLGKHKGISLYVFHQRTGLNVGGNEEKYYVCRKDSEKNIVYLCRESSVEKFLHSSVSECMCLNWINKPPKLGEILFVKSRHSPLFFEVTIDFIDSSKVIFSHEKRYVTSPGQRIAFYSKDKKICLGGGEYMLSND